MPRTPRRPVEPDTPEEFFGAELRFWRTKRGLSTSELGDAVDRNRRTITGAEAGRDIPSELLVRGLDEFLGAEGMLLARYEAVIIAKRRRRAARAVEAPGVAPDATELDASEFVSETVPDGTIMRPNQRFEKTWTIRNVGDVAWIGRHLARVGEPSGLGLITTPATVPIASTRPGETVDITVACVAQSVEGNSIAVFKMTDAEGRVYFPARYAPGLQVQVTVA